MTVDEMITMLVLDGWQVGEVGIHRNGLTKFITRGDRVQDFHGVPLGLSYKLEEWDVLGRACPDTIRLLWENIFEGKHAHPRF